MRRMNLRFIAICALILGNSCQQPEQKNTENTAPQKDSVPVTTLTSPPLREKVLTAEEQKALSPDIVIQSLKDGNSRFIRNDLTARDHSAMVRNASVGQYPKAVILSCLDSRIPVEDVFDKGIGDMFVGRIAGNFVDEDMLGSMEFGCKVSGAKLILVLGHESCGAIKAAIDNVKLGNITAMLSKIAPAVKKSQDFAGDKTSKNDAFVEYVAKNNVLNTIETIKQKSPILKEMVDKGEIKIVGAYYSLKTGEVIFL
jgi:carbonic anhydrase